jgi:hypothetical protein
MVITPRHLPLELWDHRDQWVLLEQLGRKVNKVSPVHKVILDHKDHKVFLAHKVQQVVVELLNLHQLTEMEVEKNNLLLHKVKITQLPYHQLWCLGLNLDK